MQVTKEKHRKQYWTAVSLAALAGWMVPSLENLRHWSWAMSILVMLPILPIAWGLYRLRNALPPVEETPRKNEITVPRFTYLTGSLAMFVVGVFTGRSGFFSDHKHKLLFIVLLLTCVVLAALSVMENHRKIAQKGSQ